MEHSVYLCGWRRSRAGFELWTVKAPRVSAAAETYAEAEKRLLEMIWNRGGAMQAVLEFDRPLPKSEFERKYSSPELYLICGDDTFETDSPHRALVETKDERESRLAWLDQFYVQPVCRTCACPTSRRGEREIRVTSAPRRYDGAIGFIGSEGTSFTQLLSEDFVKSLSKRERGCLTLRPVLRRGKARPFYELLGPAGPPFVAVRGLPINGWRCPDCNHACWGYFAEGVAMHEFIAASDLPRPAKDLFTVGTPPAVQLCVSGNHWRRMVGASYARGFASSPLGVVPDREVVRQPKLESRSTIK